MKTSKITNAVMVNKNNQFHLFGEVVEDVRFESGHHVLTSPLINWNEETKEGISESGTIYKVDILFSVSEFKIFMKEKYPSDYQKYLYYCGMIDEIK